MSQSQIQVPGGRSSDEKKSKNKHVGVENINIDGLVSEIDKTIKKSEHKEAPPKPKSTKTVDRSVDRCRC